MQTWWQSDRGYIKLGVNGNVDMAPANVHAKGASKLAVDWDWEF